MEKILSVLRRCPLFDAISDADLSGLLRCLNARVVFFARDAVVLGQGDAAQRIGVVLSGAVQIVRLDYFGHRSVLAHITPAQLFGEAFACAGVDALPVSAVAAQETQVLFLDSQRILNACASPCAFHRQLIFNLMRILATKNLLLHQKIEITSRRTTRDKLLAYLLDQAQQQHSHAFDIPYDRQALADYLQVERSGLSAEISKLRSEGILACRRNHFVLLQPIE